MIQLDTPDKFRQIDKEGMADRIAELPKQCLDAWRLSDVTLPADYSIIDGIIVLGMGGSAIGGDLVRTLVVDELRVPMQVVRDYDLPAFAGRNTLVIASSYSGNTEETLTAFNEAMARKCKTLVITAGGKLKEIAEQAGMPLLVFDYKAQPRAALGYSFILLLGVLQKLKLVGDKTGDLQEAVRLMENLRRQLEPSSPSALNPAKQLAAKLYGKLPVIYGGGILSEVARRWKGQVNENSKGWAFFEVMPEANHNAAVGYEFPKDLASKIVVIFLDAPAIHPRTRLRYKITQDILTKRGVSFEAVEAEGKSKLAQMMYSIYFGDYVSYYLSMLYAVDPTPVEIISFLKNELARAKA